MTGRHLHLYGVCEKSVKRVDDDHQKTENSREYRKLGGKWLLRVNELREQGHKKDDGFRVQQRNQHPLAEAFTGGRRDIASRSGRVIVHRPGY